MKAKHPVERLAQSALFAALCYVGFQFLRIPMGSSYVHLGNAFVVLAALMLDGWSGGLAGAVGLTIADLTTGNFTSAPKTFVLKLCIGLIVGLLAHKVGHLNAQTKPSKRIFWSVIASCGGMLFNVLFEPIVSYLYKTYLLGIAQDASMIMASWTAVSTAINAVIAVVVAGLLYNAVIGILRRNGLSEHPSKEKEV